jgi:DNA-directed RNA polymerase specialized sigma24 family protein
MPQPLVNADLEQSLLRARSGDPGALDDLCAAVRVRLLVLVRLKLRGWPREDHEDLVQETLAVFARDVNRIQNRPLAYAHAVLTKRIWNELDRARRSREVSLDQRIEPDDARDSSSSAASGLLRDETADVAAEVQRKLDVERVWRAIQRLSQEFCKPLLMALMQGYEVGELYLRFSELDPHLTRNAFYKRIFDCRKRLTERLGGVR